MFLCMDVSVCVTNPSLKCMWCGENEQILRIKDENHFFHTAKSYCAVWIPPTFRNKKNFCLHFLFAQLTHNKWKKECQGKRTEKRKFQLYNTQHTPKMKKKNEWKSLWEEKPILMKRHDNKMHSHKLFISFRYELPVALQRYIF